MKKWPAGSHVVLEGNKYTKRKVICFIATKESENMEVRTPYEAKWKDDFGATVLSEQNHIVGSEILLVCNCIEELTPPNDPLSYPP